MKTADTTISPPPEVSCAASAAVGPPTQTGGGSSRQLLDLAGKRFGRWLVLEFAGIDSHHNKLWSCLCDCGVKRAVVGSSLVRGYSQSCGCLKRERSSTAKQLRLEGQIFGRLTVLRAIGLYRKRVQLWECRCTCGNLTRVRTDNLTNGHIKSCGCYRRDLPRLTKFNPNLSEADRVRQRRYPDGTRPLLKLSKQIYARDDYTCFVCGTRGCRLAAHHLEPWALYPDLRYDLANLVTLCKECHYQFHQLYGNDCDLDDFEEFLKP